MFLKVCSNIGILHDFVYILRAWVEGLTPKLCGANGAQHSLRQNERIVMHFQEFVAFSC